MYKLSSVNSNQDTISYISSQQGFSDNPENSIENFKFYKFSLQELGLPSADILLKSVLSIKNQVGLQGWKNIKGESNHYRGFSLTYNPTFFDKDQSMYHQSWGSNLLMQNYGRKNGLGNHSFIKNTYYDSYGFRSTPSIITQELHYLFNKFTCSLVRSRVAFLNLHKCPINDTGWHVDEPPYHLFRVNIPLQTSEEYILEIKGSDEFGNRLDLSKHLTVGNAYIWNTRIPHRVCINKPCLNLDDRIHMVLGFSPWFDYVGAEDAFVKSKLHGQSLHKIISEKIFVNI